MNKIKRENSIFGRYIEKKYKLFNRYLSRSPENTKKIAQNLSEELKEGSVIGLDGDLGSGKTTFMKGITKSYGIKANEVISPTFVLIRIYKGSKTIYHIDLYRITEYKELENIGYRDFLTLADFIFIEWADRIREIYKDFDWIINFEYVSKKQRKITIYRRR